MWIRGVTVLRNDSGSWTAGECDLELAGRVIRQVAPPAPAAVLGPQDMSGRGLLAIPGLVNLHHHSNDSFFRGRHERLPLELYMLHAGLPWGLDRAPGRRMVEVRTLLASAEMLLTGTTSVLDDCYPTGALEPGLLDTVCRAYERIGIRAWVAVDLSDLPMPATVTGLAAAMTGEQAAAIPAPSRDWRRDLGLCRDWIASRTSGGRVTSMVAASGPQRCGDALLTAVAELAHDTDGVWATHALETRTQALTGYDRYGESIIAHLRRLGILDERAILAHCVWLADADIGLLADSGATAVHNPTSNLRLGSGIAPVPAMLAAGVNVGLGTDGIASNDAQNLLLEMRLAASLHNITSPDPATWLAAGDVLDMATRAGGAALRAPGLGGLGPGSPADLVLLRTREPAFTPLGDWVRNLVFAEYGRAVDTVIVDGAVVVRGGRLLTVDLDDLMAEAAELADEFFAQNETALARVAEFEPPVRETLRAAHERPLPAAPASFVAGETS